RTVTGVQTCALPISGSATKPFPGVDAAIYNEKGKEVPAGGGGFLVLRRPWPAMLRGIHKDHDRFVETYWSKYRDTYFVSDGAREIGRASCRERVEIW